MELGRGVHRGGVGAGGIEVVAIDSRAGYAAALRAVLRNSETGARPCGCPKLRIGLLSWRSVTGEVAA